ncbi:MAG TPA: GNAT family N-acetyltransferase [Iamia sp.]|jgi:RimJ/RimL family protein N-acetyltransferase|nr:GNAT family N-acetyltransferase [Iamia sp.]
MELLRTDRVVLRAWRDDEADRLLDIHRRPEVRRWIDDDQDDPVLWTTRDKAVETIARYAAELEPGNPVGFWAVEERATGVAAGTVLITTAGSDPPPDETEVEIGWHLHPDAWGRGLAREAAGALLAAGLERRPRINALMYVDNEPSAEVARAIGMVEQPISVDRFYPGESRHFIAEA